MKTLDPKKVQSFVERNIPSFHASRLESLKTLKLNKILLRKNPYLFRSKNILEAGELVKTLLEAHLSSQEETLFGEFLESLARFVSNQQSKGDKSTGDGIDLEFKREKVKYIVSIKSGPNWGNSSQIKKMKADFKTASQKLRQGNHGLQVVAVNGCCYGRVKQQDQGEYRKICGQAFWEFISGSSNLYLEIIEPLGYKADVHNEAFKCQYAAIVNSFTAEFVRNFCFANGSIDWEKLVKFNSAKEKPKPPKKPPKVNKEKKA